MTKEQIKKEAKQILDKFSKSLDKVSTKVKPLKDKLGGMREEGSGQEPDPEFKKRFFQNAPKTDGDFIISEKKRW